MQRGWTSPIGAGTTAMSTRITVRPRRTPKKTPMPLNLATGGLSEFDKRPRSCSGFGFDRLPVDVDDSTAHFGNSVASDGLGGVIGQPGVKVVVVQNFEHCLRKLVRLVLDDKSVLALFDIRAGPAASHADRGQTIGHR